MGVFEESYRTLNAAQRQAVDAIDGPVLVVAGPGTGKTQLLSMRVANILRKTDVDAGNILCLTFTNKAAVNMQERILALTGGEAKGVMVKTFHSFAAEIMNMYPDYFWNGARLSTIPDATQLDIIQQILSSLPLDNPLAIKFAGQFTAGRDVRAALKHVKEAGLTPDKLRALVTANLAYLDIVEPLLIDATAKPLSAKRLSELQSTIASLPKQGISATLQPLQDLGQVIIDGLDFAIQQDADSGKTKHTGKWKQRWIQSVDGKKGMHKERERNAWWLHLADVYALYREAIHARGYYDYSDMIVEVITQLQQHGAMRADVQERFLYIMIDEFQDTNAAQLQLANVVANRPDDTRPNIMAVGDDDQSIYKFNGAELNNMLSFSTSYPTAQTIVLTDNYRSSQDILDVSSGIIAQVSDRLTTRKPELNKQLRSQITPTTPSSLAHLSYPTEAHELSELARRIADEYTADDGSIAVLARDHASLRRLAAILTKLEIPVSYEQQNNVLELPIIQYIHQLAALIVAIEAGNSKLVDVLLSKVIRAPFWKLSPEQLWQLATNTKYTSWLERLQHGSAELQNIASWLLWLSTQTHILPLPTMLEYIVGLRAGEHFTSPIERYYFADQAVTTDFLTCLSSLRLLMSSANDFARRGQVSLHDFVRFLDVSIENGEIIADESAFVTGDRAVHLLTVHKAKGLEFDTVHIINAIDANWRPGIGGRKCPANLPLQPVGDDMDDYARLMFVAATRAKQHLFAHSYQQDVAGKDVLATPLLANVLTIHEEKITTDPITILEEHLSWPHLSSSDEKRNLSSRLENFSLSASALLDFLDVSSGGPQNFFERHLLRLPSVTTPNMAFGTAMHAALEYAQVQHNAGSHDITKILERFESSLREQLLSEHDTQRYIPHGKQLLEKLLSSDTFWLGDGDLTEQMLADVRIGAATLKGALDRVHQNKDGLIIIDYKTGKPLGSLTTRDQTKAIKAWRHRMQLIFYALLVRESKRFKPKTVTGQMWYIEASQPKELIRDYSPSNQELDHMQKLINAIWHKIGELNLPDIRHYSSDYAGIQAFEQDLIDGSI